VEKEKGARAEAVDSYWERERCDAGPVGGLRAWVQTPHVRKINRFWHKHFPNHDFYEV
jgi:hypothetical protein